MSGCLACLQSQTNRIAPSSTLSHGKHHELRSDRQLHIVQLHHNATNAERGNYSIDKPRVNTDTGILKDVGAFPDGSTTLFFIHGVGGSTEVWRSQYEYFYSLGYDVIVPDLIGHGLSAAPTQKAAYHFSQIALDILALFDHFYNTRNVIIGHSYGSSFATYVAKERENLVTKLVLISGGGPTPLSPQPGLFQLPICMLNCLKTTIVERLLRKAFHKSHDQEKNRTLAFKIPTYVLRHTMRGQDWMAGNEDFHGSLLVPTLLIYGNNDQLVTVEEEIAMKECINGSKLVVIDEASHMITMEKPEIINKFIHQFLTLREWRFDIKIDSEHNNSGPRPRPSPFNVIE